MLLSKNTMGKTPKACIDSLRNREDHNDKLVYLLGYAVMRLGRRMGGGL